jgi:shikimate dehydrogenase
MKMKVNDFLDNSLNLKHSEKYAGILGANPSEGARSPVLWNGAFKAYGLNIKMYPMDVSDNNLVGLLNYLDKDNNFIGGAIAVPHKEKVAKWLIEKGLGYISEEAYTIGAVNSLYRSKNGHIKGTNTDGEAATISLNHVKQNIEGSNVLLIGPGGAGKAVATYVKKAIKSGQLFISTRNPSKVNLLGRQLNAKILKWPVEIELLKKIDILINCSILGSYSKVEINGVMQSLEAYTPLNLETSEDKIVSLLSNISSNALIFDIIYDPDTTKLLKLSVELGLETLNGKKMNIDQAVLAFEYAVPEAKDRELIHKSMIQALN